MAVISDDLETRDANALSRDISCPKPGGTEFFVSVFVARSQFEVDPSQSQTTAVLLMILVVLFRQRFHLRPVRENQFQVPDYEDGCRICRQHSLRGILAIAELVFIVLFRDHARM